MQYTPEPQTHNPQLSTPREFEIQIRKGLSNMYDLQIVNTRPSPPCEYEIQARIELSNMRTHIRP